MKLPCNNCIAFPICIANIPMRNSGTALASYIESTLMKKCILIHDFVYDDGNSGSRMMEVKEYFRKKINE